MKQPCPEPVEGQKNARFDRLSARFVWYGIDGNDF